MLEIIIYKSQGGRSLVKQFSNSYLFNGADNYVSADAYTIMTRLAEAESRIYFDETHFMRGVIRQLDATGRHIDGETRTETFNIQGATALPVGSVVCPPNIVVGYQKQVLVGRNGVTLYRNALSSDEYNTYMETGAIPARLNASHAPGVLPAAFFTQAMKDVTDGTGNEMMLPLNKRYAAGAVRPVIDIDFAGVRFRQETHQRESGAQNLVEAVQQLINENGSSIRRLWKQYGNATGQLAQGILNTIVQLFVNAFARYALLSIAQRALVRFPAIYAATELLALLPPGTIPS